MPLRPDPSDQIVVDTSSGILFIMFDGERRVLCEIEWAALCDRAIVDGTDEKDVRGTFARHRETIQGIASKNYDAGQERPRITTYQLTDIG